MDWTTNGVVSSMVARKLRFKDLASFRCVSKGAQNGVQNSQQDCKKKLKQVMNVLKDLNPDNLQAVIMGAIELFQAPEEHKNVVEFLKEYRDYFYGSCDGNTKTEMRQAVMEKLPENVKELVHRELDKLCQFVLVKTTVDQAQIYMLLMDDVDKRDQNGLTLFQRIVDSDIHIENDNSSTELVKRRSKAMMSMIITNGADINVRDQHGGTVLHATNLLSKRLASPTMKYLINAGIGVNAKNNMGKTALE